jgi:hypothetical protein
MVARPRVFITTHKLTPSPVRTIRCMGIAYDWTSEGNPSKSVKRANATSSLVSPRTQSGLRKHADGTMGELGAGGGRNER